MTPNGIGFSFLILQSAGGWIDLRSIGLMPACNLWGSSHAAGLCVVYAQA